MVSAGVPNVSAAHANSVARRDGYVHEGQSTAAQTLALESHILTVLQEVAKVCPHRPHAVSTRSPNDAATPDDLT